MENNAYANFWGLKEVYYGICKSGEWRFAFYTRAEIEHVIATIFQPGGRSEISARAETHYVIIPLHGKLAYSLWNTKRMA